MSRFRRTRSRSSLAARACALLALFFGLTVLGACEGTNAFSGPVFGEVGGGAGDAGGDLVIEVDTRGDTTTYAWQGGAARSLEVRNLETAEVIWRIVARDLSEGFSPPVEHARPPAEAVEEVEASIVATGERHEVTIVLTDGTGGAETFSP